jgi:hypothetical protein
MTEKKEKVEQLLNPEVRELILGIRKLKKIVIYPLSYYDQKQIGELIAKSMGKLGETLNAEENTAFIGKLSDMIEQNIPQIIEKCTDLKSEIFMKQVTSGQLMEFIQIVMEVNFLNPIQKGTNLFVSLGNLYESNPSSPQSVNITDINSSTSENLSKMVD